MLGCRCAWGILAYARNHPPVTTKALQVIATKADPGAQFRAGRSVEYPPKNHHCLSTDTVSAIIFDDDSAVELGRWCGTLRSAAFAAFTLQPELNVVR